MNDNNKPVKNIVVVGGTNIDDIIILDGRMPMDAKINPDYSAKGLGGGGANSALALKILNEVFNDDIDISLVTKIGYGKENQFVSEVLSHGSNIQLIDAIESQRAEIPHNTVISHEGGRVIFRRATFNHAAIELSPNAHDQIEAAIANADLVLIQTKHPRIAKIAADLAAANFVPAVIDFSNKECPTDIMHYASAILMPAEHVFTDMKDGEDLLDYVSANTAYDPYIVMSDSNKDTVRLWNGERKNIASLSVHTKDPLGAGDLRDAAFAFFLVRENEPDVALRKANIIASLSCEYYGREWEKDLAARLQDFPEFDEDFGTPTQAPVAAPQII